MFESLKFYCVFFYSQKKKATSDEDFKSKSVKSKGGKSSTSKPSEEKDSDLSEEDTGRRRSARVRNLRSRKKEPSPDFIPSELEDFITDLDSDDEEFVVKSKRRKKKQVMVGAYNLKPYLYVVVPEG